MKKEEDLDDDNLPEEGIHNIDGVLFYHAKPLDMTKAQFERATKFGINLRTKRPFTLEESVQIFENWRKFAKEHKMKVHKAHEYISAKRINNNGLMVHQDENRFWPKLCSGLPHRCAKRIRQRALLMLTEPFLSQLDWNDPVPQIAEKFYSSSDYCAVEMEKVRKLMEKGYSTSHLAEILEINEQKARGMTTKLRRLDKRNDVEMRSTFFAACVQLGLSTEKLKSRLETGKTVEKIIKKAKKSIDFEKLALEMHISHERCTQFLEQILGEIVKNFEKSKNGGMDDEEAYEEAMQVVSTKERITQEQSLAALEIICKLMDKAETSRDLVKNTKMAEEIKSRGITNFWSNVPEYQYLMNKIIRDFLYPLESSILDNLRREFRHQLRLHFVLWGLKKVLVWDKLQPENGATRYETVLNHEKSNEMCSGLTRKFLNDRNVVEWITTPIKKPSKRHLMMESFILYTKNRLNFKFPAKLVKNIPKPSEIVAKLLEEADESNWEYLTIKQVKNGVETAAESKIAVKLTNKLILVKEGGGDGGESGEEEADGGEMVEYSKELEMASLDSKYRRMKEQVEEMMENVEKLAPKASDDVTGPKNGRKRRKVDADDVTESKKVKKAKKSIILAPEDSEDVPEVPEASGDVTKPTNSKKRRKLAPEDSEDVPEAPEASDDVTTSKKSKKSTISAPEDPDDAPEGPEASDDVTKPKNAKKQRKLAPEASDDVTTSKKTKKAKKSIIWAPEDLEASDDVTKPKKSKKRQKLDSDDVITLKKSKNR